MKNNRLIILFNILLFSLLISGCTNSKIIKTSNNKIINKHYLLNHPLNITTVYEFQNKTNISKTDSINNAKANNNYYNIALIWAKAIFNFNTHPQNIANLGKSTFNYQIARQAQKKNNTKAWVQFANLDNLNRPTEADTIITSQSIKNNSNLINNKLLFHNFNLINLSLINLHNYINDKRNSIKATSGYINGINYIEKIIKNYLNKHTNQAIYYVVIPTYLNNEKIIRGSYIQAYSVNDHGKAINFSYWVFNAQKNEKINYYSN